MATIEGDDQVQRILRLTDIEKDPLEEFIPISGYEETPVETLETAVEPLISFLPAVQSYASIAKQQCKDKGPPADNLTIDESASIMLYSMGWTPLDKCLYVALNATLRSNDRDKLEPWFRYLKLFLTALSRLPSVDRRVFRGVKLDLIAQYQTRKTIVWRGFSSSTTSIKVLESELFLGKTGTRTMFSIDCTSGKNIRQHSYFPAEDEILLLAATKFKILGCADLGNGLHTIQLEEVQPSCLLLSPALPSSRYEWKQNAITIAGKNGRGNQLDQLFSPRGISIVDDEQCIYIADHLNHRIVKWKFGARYGKVITSGNTEKDLFDQLNGPTDVIFDRKTDSLIICDRGNRRVIQRFRQNDMNGQTIISKIDCQNLAMDNNGDLYVSDYKKHEVRRWKIGEEKGTIVAGGHGEGNHFNQLDYPTFIFVDQNYSLYVSDRLNHRVVKWLKGAKEGIIVAGGQGQGHKLTQLSNPRGLTVDHLGNLYVADSDNQRIMRWLKGSKKGSVIVGGYGPGTDSNQFNSLRGLTFDQHRNLYVVDHWNNRVQKFEINS